MNPNQPYTFFKKNPEKNLKKKSRKHFLCHKNNTKTETVIVLQIFSGCLKRLYSLTSSLFLNILLCVNSTQDLILLIVMLILKIVNY